MLLWEPGLSGFHSAFGVELLAVSHQTYFPVSSSFVNSKCHISFLLAWAKSGLNFSDAECLPTSSIPGNMLCAVLLEAP